MISSSYLDVLELFSSASQGEGYATGDAGVPCKLSRTLGAIEPEYRQVLVETGWVKIDWTDVVLNAAPDGETIEQMRKRSTDRLLPVYWGPLLCGLFGIVFLCIGLPASKNAEGR
jgi:hypothetical protein